MKAIKTIRDSNRGYSDKYEILNLFAVDLLKEILEDIQDLRQDCEISEEYGSDIEWVRRKDGDYLDYEKVEYRINQKIKELKNIS